MDDTANLEINEALKQRFSTLPQVIKDAITSADVTKHLRDVAQVHKLHLDQWQKLENEVMLALLGFDRVENLQANIQKEIRVDATVAADIATKISEIVFEPVRGELERMLDHPDAQAAEVSNVEAARTAVLAEEARPTVQPATPPAPGPTQSAVRSQISASDPYREQPL